MSWVSYCCFTTFYPRGGPRGGGVGGGGETSEMPTNASFLLLVLPLLLILLLLLLRRQCRLPSPPSPPQPHPPSKSSLGEEGRAELALSLDPLEALVRALCWSRDACSSSPSPALHSSSSRRAHRRHLAGPFTGPITGWRLLDNFRYLLAEHWIICQFILRNCSNL